MAMHRYLLIPIALAALILSAAMAQETKDLLLEKRFKQAYQDALQTAQEIADEMYRFDALMRIAEALVKVGEIDHALQVFDLAIKVAQIEHPSWRSKDLCNVAQGLAKARQFHRAIKVAQEIEDAMERSLAFKGVAEELVRARQPDHANQLFSLAIQATQKIKGASDRSWALKEIAEGLTKIGQIDRAIEVFDLAIQNAQEIRSATARSEALRRIAEALVKAGQIDRATKVLNLAIKAALKIEDKLERSGMFIEIAEGLTKVRQFDLAIQIAQKLKTSGSAHMRFGKSPAGWREQDSLTVPLKSHKKLKPQWSVQLHLV